MRQRRLEESDAEKQDRLQKNRKINYLTIANESEEQRAHRLSLMRTYTNLSRSNETLEIRAR